MTEQQVCNLLALLSLIVIISFIIGYIAGRIMP